MRLGLAEQEASEHLALGAARDAGVGTLEAGREIVSLEGLRGGAAVERDRALRLAASLEVLGEHDGLALADLFEPLRGKLVADDPILVGEHRVRGLGDERVPEDVLLLAAELRLLATAHDL